MDYAKESLRLHGEWKGKIEVIATVPVETKDDLSLAYTPGVAEPCLAIQKDIEKSYELTRRHNMCLVVTDGSAVLGLGDIGPEAGMPVMEGKCVLFKAFGDVDAFPLCIKSKDVDEIVNTIYLISGSFGGVNLEDIAAPRCFEIERKLKEKCDIPIFHDDQHGTASVIMAVPCWSSWDSHYYTGWTYQCIKSGWKEERRCACGCQWSRRSSNINYKAFT